MPFDYQENVAVVHILLGRNNGKSEIVKVFSNKDDAETFKELVEATNNYTDLTIQTEEVFEMKDDV